MNANDAARTREDDVDVSGLAQIHKVAQEPWCADARYARLVLHRLLAVRRRIDHELYVLLQSIYLLAKQHFPHSAPACHFARVVQHESPPGPLFTLTIRFFEGNADQGHSFIRARVAHPGRIRAVAGSGSGSISRSVSGSVSVSGSFSRLCSCGEWSKWSPVSALWLLLSAPR